MTTQTRIYSSIFKKRNENSIKEIYHVLLIAGNTSKIGAALIAAKVLFVFAIC
jgi:hypothetical protein